MGANRCVEAFRHTGGTQTYREGVQTYGGVQMYGASKHTGHPDTHGAYEHWGAYGYSLSLTTPIPASEVGKHFMI